MDHVGLVTADARAATRHLADLLRRERAALAEFLVALAEFDRARRWVELGYCGLFEFLRRELGLSTGAAHYRKTAAQLLQRCPGVVEPLRDGRLCFTTVLELAKVVTPENCAAILPRFFHRSRHEAQGIVAELVPAETVPARDVVAVLRAAGVARTSVAAGAANAATIALPPPPSGELEVATGAAPCSDAEDAAASAAPPARAPSGLGDEAAPQATTLCRMHVTLSSRVLRKLECARDALSRGRAAPTTEEVLEAALDLLLAEGARRRALSTRSRTARASRAPTTSTGSACTPLATSPSARAQEAARSGRAAAAAVGGCTGAAGGSDEAVPAPPRSRYVPAELRREVWTRDGARCQWPLEGGGVCGATRHLELDHLQPFAAGGATTAANLRVVCAFHNRLGARRFFGDGWIEAMTRRRRPVTRPGRQLG